MTGTPAPIPADRTVQEALVIAARAVGPVPKADRNKDQGFQYRGMERILAAAGPALQEAGVSVVPQVVDMIRGTMERGRDRNLWQHYVLTVEYLFTGPDGSTLVARVVSEGLDNGDKGLSKAMTMAYKTALLQVLQVGDDTHDADASGPSDGPAQARQAPAKKAPAKKAPAKAAAPAKKAAARPRQTIEERVAPVVERHGAEHAAKVADVLRRLDALPKENRAAVKQAFAQAYGSPVDLDPAGLAAAVVWLDEMLAPSSAADGATADDGEGPDRDDAPGSLAAIPDDETPEQRAARMGFCATCGAMTGEGEAHEDDCPEGPF